MSDAATVVVAGTVNHDVLVSPEGRITESLGGVLYNVAPLAALLEGTGWRVRPVARLGARDLDRAARLLERFPSADPSGLIADPRGTNRCRLDYSRDARDRWEEVDLRVPPLEVGDLAGVDRVRAWLVNMVSGRDVPLPVAESLRASASPTSLFLLDIQALARGTGRPRHPRRVDDWERWARTFRVVRGNELEVAWFGDAPGDLRRAIENVLHAGAEEVLVTRGPRGSLRALLEDGRLRIDEIPAYPPPGDGPGEVTGCGDAYLAGVCAGRLFGLRPFEAAHLGSWTAAQVVGITGIEAMTELAGLRERASRAAPTFALLASDPVSPPARRGGR